MEFDQLAIPSPARIFVSSTSYDLATVRQELGDFLTELGYQVVLFESAAAFPSVDGPTSALRHAVQCDVCILIVGARYGMRAEPASVSYTHSEYRAARDAGKPIFAFIHQETLVKLELFAQRQNPDFWSAEETDLFRFVKEISSERTRFPFLNLSELKRAIKHQLISYFGYLLRAYSELEAVTPTTSSQWRHTGNIFWNAARFGQAIYCFRKAAAADRYGDAAVAMVSLAECLRITGRPKESLGVCSEGIEKYPLETVGFSIQVTYCLFDLGRDSEALRNAERLAERFPEDWRPWDTLRYVYYRLGQVGKAAGAAKRAFELAPELTDLRLKANIFAEFPEAASDKDG